MTAATSPASRRGRNRHPRRGRQVAGAGRAPARACARARRHLPRRDGGADEGAGPVRRHHRHRLRRARALRHHLRPHRAAGLGGVDVARRHLQLAPDHGGLRRARRHRGAEARLPAALRHRRAARRPGADRARLRHRPAGDPHPRRARGQRRLSRQRHQDLDLQRHPRPGVRPAGQDRPRRRAAPQGHEHAAGREGAGLPRLAQAGEDRLQGHRLGRADLRGLSRAGRRR